MNNKHYKKVSVTYVEIMRGFKSTINGNRIVVGAVSPNKSNLSMRKNEIKLIFLQKKQ